MHSSFEFAARSGSVPSASASAVALGVLVLASLALAGCGARPAKDFRGSWKPVNRFQTQPRRIPLDRAYTFYAAPMDETLRSMLTRWAKDTGRTLDYRLDYDVTLYRAAAVIRTTDLVRASEQLNAIFAEQGVHVAGLPREIVVRAASHRPASPPKPAGADALREAHP